MNTQNGNATETDLSRIVLKKAKQILYPFKFMTDEIYCWVGPENGQTALFKLTGKRGQYDKQEMQAICWRGGMWHCDCKFARLTRIMLASKERFPLGPRIIAPDSDEGAKILNLIKSAFWRGLGTLSDELRTYTYAAYLKVKYGAGDQDISGGGPNIRIAVKWSNDKNGFFAEFAVAPGEAVLSKCGGGYVFNGELAGPVKLFRVWDGCDMAFRGFEAMDGRAADAKYLDSSWDCTFFGIKADRQMQLIGAKAERLLQSMRLRTNWEAPANVMERNIVGGFFYHALPVSSFKNDANQPERVCYWDDYDVAHSAGLNEFGPPGKVVPPPPVDAP